MVARLEALSMTGFSDPVKVWIPGLPRLRPPYAVVLDWQRLTTMQCDDVLPEKRRRKK